MKKYTVPLILLVVVLQAGAWFNVASQLLNGGGDTRAMLSSARKDVDDGLYHKAVLAYEEILLMEDTAEVRTELLNAYQLYYTENPTGTVRRAIDEHLTDFIANYPKLAAAYESAAAYYMAMLDYEKLLPLLRTAETQGVESELLSTLRGDTAYHYTLASAGGYSQIVTWQNGSYAVEKGGSWLYVKLTGGSLISGFEATGPFSDGLAFARRNGRAMFLDSSGVPQLYLDDKYIYGFGHLDGIAVLTDGTTYDYVSTSGEVTHGGYAAATAQYNDRALVKTGAGWQLVNGAGEVLQATGFTEIVGGRTGFFNASPSFGALQDGAWRLYSSTDLAPVGTFSCDVLDYISSDGATAFAMDGKWGFVDAAGNVVLQPTYEVARSFSGGYAAVCIDGLWGFIGTDGTLVVEPAFEDVDYFNTQRRCMVYSDGVWSLLAFLWDLY